MSLRNAPTTGAVAGGPRRLPYFAGLDGLRGLGMAAVLVYHAQLGIQGAALAVSQFFTLSGFLIMSLVLNRGSFRSTKDLIPFWAGRYRRLAPASLITLGFVVLFGATLATRQQLDELLSTVVAALGQVVNWYFVLTDVSYVRLFQEPSPLQHFWSLAIEEQFYLLMPVSLFLLFRITQNLRVITAIFGVATLASAATMFVLFERGASIDRLYYGTDTRAAEILIGCVLALVLHQRPLEVSASQRKVIGVVGVGAAILSYWAWFAVPLVHPSLYRGGFLAYSGLTVLMIVTMLTKAGPVSVLLSWGPLVWLGRMSYTVYTFHWPLYLWLTPDRVGLDDWGLLAVRVPVTIGLAALSVYLLEQRIRYGTRRQGDRRLPIAFASSVLVIVGLTVTVVSVVEADDPLATLRSDEVAGSLPIAAPDGILDVLAIGQADDSGVLAALRTRVEEEPAATFAQGDAFACRGGLVPTDTGRTCANWAEEWPALIEEHDPDVVVIYAAEWTGDKLAPLAIAEGISETELQAEVLDGGFDLLARRGASILWTSERADFATELQRSFGPFRQAMDVVEGTRDDLFRTVGNQLPIAAEVPASQLRSESAELLLTNAALYSRGERRGLERVMIVGDSQARSMGYGLERWAAEEQVAWVWNVAVEGCGFVRQGFTAGFGGEQPVTEQCKAVREDWPSQIKSFQPDLVIVLSSVWDIADRRLPDWEQPLGPGDDRFDDYLLEEYAGVVDELTASGAELTWVNPPCAELRGGSSSTPAVEVPSDKIDRLNDAILPALDAARPGVLEFFDLDAVLCPGGEAIRSVTGVDEVRFDGVHFSVEGSLWFARKYGAELIRVT